MENDDKTINEKPKGNVLQNDNREDEAGADNLKEELKTKESQVLTQNDSQQTNNDSKPPTQNDGD